MDYAARRAAICAGSATAKLEPGMEFAGPAIIEDPGTTIVVHPGNRVAIDGYGNVIITLAN